MWWLISHLATWTIEPWTRSSPEVTSASGSPSSHTLEVSPTRPACILAGCLYTNFDDFWENYLAYDIASQVIYGMQGIR